MGMQGPLTAQALGRSPYDEVVELNEVENEDAPETAQQYDQRGRPINPNTKRINRDIIRSHNEVMLVIGVAEPENPAPAAELHSQQQHDEYEDNAGLALISMASRCIETVGVFGIHGFRQRILIYKRYSAIPFWDLYRRAKNDFSFSRDVLPGATASLLANYIERNISTLWQDRMDRMIARQFVHEIWSYVKVHLELFVATQRLGLIPNTHWLPPVSYFIPFTEASPIPAPALPEDFTPGSILQWLGSICISATPFLVWVMTQRMMRDWRRQLWHQIFSRLPNTRRLFPPPPPPPPPPVNQTHEEPTPRTELNHDRAPNHEGSPPQTVDNHVPGDHGPVGAVRRASTFSARGDEYISDEDENEGLTATLISFDVEATETTEAPAGLWSAELRPSANPDTRGSISGRGPMYQDTLLTQLPALVASHIFTDAVLRLLIAPYEATALRLVARTIRLRQGLPCTDIFGVNLLNGLSRTLVTNFLGIQFFHLVLSGEVWATFTTVSQYFHMTQEEWEQSDGKGSSWWFID